MSPLGSPWLILILPNNVEDKYQRTNIDLQVKKKIGTNQKMGNGSYNSPVYKFNIIRLWSRCTQTLGCIDPLCAEFHFLEVFLKL